MEWLTKVTYIQKETYRQKRRIYSGAHARVCVCERERQRSCLHLLILFWPIDIWTKLAIHCVYEWEMNLMYITYCKHASTSTSYNMVGKLGESVHTIKECLTHGYVHCHLNNIPRVAYACVNWASAISYQENCCSLQAHMLQTIIHRGFFYRNYLTHDTPSHAFSQNSMHRHIWESHS